MILQSLSILMNQESISLFQGNMVDVGEAKKSRVAFLANVTPEKVLLPVKFRIK